MSGGLVASLAVGIFALAFVLAPLFRRDAAQAERVAAATSTVRELQSRREMLLGALKDLEDDRATGKLDDHDYDELKGKLTSQAVDVMKRLDELGVRGE